LEAEALASGHPRKMGQEKGEKYFMAYLNNTVRLIGFLGKDAEVKSTKSGNEYTVLSLATQASWKDKKSGEYVNRTG
jgi:Single-strand binding protein family